MVAKWKVSQNEADPDKRGVIQGMSDESDPHSNSVLANIEGVGKEK